MKRYFFKTLLGIGAGLMFAPMAMATCTPDNSLYGFCWYTTGSVRCNNLHATGIGSSNSSTGYKYMNCDATPYTAGNTIAPADGIEVIPFCRNKGGKVAPGQIFKVLANFTGTTSIPDDSIDTNGVAKGITVEAIAPRSDYEGVDPAVVCPNGKNWTVIDIVPVTMDTLVTVTDDSTPPNVLSSSDWSCTLPNPTTLTWDDAAGRPEQRKYNCTMWNSSN